MRRGSCRDRASGPDWRASVPARIYCAGFVVFTLGVGDFVAATGTWQVVTALASVVGLHPRVTAELAAGVPAR